jgi:hypothetical protein
MERVGIYPVGVAMAQPSVSAPAPSNPCTPTLSSTTAAFGASGGSSSFSVSAGSTCSWTAASNVAWIQVTSGATELGYGTVGYNVSANTSTSSRKGTLTIAGQTATVSQAGAAYTSPTTSGFALRVNSGGKAYIDPLGNTWSTDTGYYYGAPWATSSSIANTTTPAIYQSVRYGVGFGYRFSVPNGSYTVRLKFAEVSQRAAGQRVFDVSINGARVLTNFDIIAASGAPLVAVDRVFPVTVGGGQIVIDFTSGPANSPAVSAIEILVKP